MINIVIDGEQAIILDEILYQYLLLVEEAEGIFDDDEYQLIENIRTQIESQLDRQEGGR